MAEQGDVTVDTLLRGRVTLLQPVYGLRTSLDPIFLAAFVAPPFGRFLDIGCGTGALSFLLLAHDPAATGVGVELQPSLAALADAGRARNGVEARLAVKAGDARTLARDLGAARFDLIVTNPPFFRVEDRQPSPDASRALAMHEIALTLADWTDLAARAVRPGGRVAAIFPAERAFELGEALRARDLSPTRLRSVHASVDRPAMRVLVEAERGGRRPLVIEPPLVVHSHAHTDGGATFSPEVLRMLGMPG